MLQRLLVLSMALLMASCASTMQQPQTLPATSYDLLIRNGLILDGSGRAAYRADIAVSEGKIQAVGELSAASASRVIDANGRMLSPGFIDLHSHAENDVLRRPLAENNIRQGVTTLLGGNCGGSPVDIADYRAKLTAQGVALNVGLLIGHNSVRREVMGTDDRKASPDELVAMQAMVDKAMSDGAFGLSSGLIYIPGTFAPPEELVALAKQVKPYDGFYVSHMRSEGSKVMAAVQETIDVGLATGVPVHISHHKTSGPSAWSKSVETLKLIDSYRAQGLDITLDQYPYTASNTNLGVLFPSWALAGGQKEFIKRTQDPDTLVKIRQGVMDKMLRQRSGLELWRIQISRYNKDTSLEGKNFEQVLIERGLDLTLENAADLALELQINGGGRGIYHTMQDDDVERIMRHPMTSVASDGRGVEWGKGSPHPRNYGTYPRTLAVYVRDKGILSLPEAVHKMTGMPAARMGLTDRGLLKVGYQADIVIWDPERIQDHLTYADPHQYATGVDSVIVNGVAVLDEGVMTGARPGQALAHHR